MPERQIETLHQRDERLPKGDLPFTGLEGDPLRQQALEHIGVIQVWRFGAPDDFGGARTLAYDLAVDQHLDLVCERARFQLSCGGYLDGRSGVGLLDEAEVNDL